MPHYVRKLLPGGHPDLRFDQVHVGDHFSYRMLDLDAGIHLDKVVVALLIPQEFHCPGATIANFPQCLGHARSQLLSGLRIHGGRGRLLNQLLVAPLDAALALAQMHDATVAVSQHLELDVARPFDELLHIDVWNAEGLLGFIARGLKRRD